MYPVVGITNNQYSMIECVSQETSMLFIKESIYASCKINVFKCLVFCLNLDLPKTGYFVKLEQVDCLAMKLPPCEIWQKKCWRNIRA